MLVLANNYALLVGVSKFRSANGAFMPKRLDSPGAGSRVLQAPAPISRTKKAYRPSPARDREGKFVSPASGVHAAVPGSQRPGSAIARSWRYGVASGSSRVVLPGTHPSPPRVFQSQAAASVH